ncbi:MAG TPA: LptF/LptG family permease [Gemmataceae bacterium]|nr:LptF/LptG family permease [Gemmataceae bacterium]
MIKHIDRLLIRGYLKAYVVCLVSLLSLYIVVDLFSNLDEFTQKHQNLIGVLQHIGTYYGYMSAQIFNQLGESVVLLAAMFTVAWMQRNNELLPLLSAGVSTRRVVMPVLLSACAMLSLVVLNQELVIARIGNRFLYEKDDPQGEKEVEVQGAYEPNGIHLHGRVGSRKTMIVKDFCCTIPEGLASNLLHLCAQEARYIPPGNGPRSGGWLMTGTQPPRLEGWERPDILEVIDDGKYFLKTAEVDLEVLLRNRKWFNYASTWRLYRQLQSPDSSRLAAMAVLFHMRLTRPILGVILVLLGLSVILRDQNRNVFISAGLCLILCGIFFAACFTCKSLGDNDLVAPALAAWLPVLCFGPLALVMFDAVHT